MQENTDLNGLRGWLILVGISVVLSPVRLLASYIPMYYGIFTDGTFTLLTSVDSSLYHPLWAPLLISEVIYNSLMVLAFIYLIYLFFSKHYLFPRWYIALLLTSLFFIVFNAWLGSQVIVNEPMFDPDTLKELGRSLFGVLIWVPYMLRSKRVKATFINKKPRQKELPHYH